MRRRPRRPSTRAADRILPGGSRVGWGGRRLALTALGILACGGATFDGRVYDNGELAFRVGPVPRGWRRVEVSHALVAFRDDARSATIAVNGRCGKDGDDVPLEALTHHLFLHFTERNVSSAQRFDLDGREALRTRLLAKLDGVEKRFEIVVLKKDECVYDFVHIADGRDETTEDFSAFVAGFSTVER